MQMTVDRTVQTSGLTNPVMGAGGNPQSTHARCELHVYASYSQLHMMPSEARVSPQWLSQSASIETEASHRIEHEQTQEFSQS
jgi:hypothetical protein